VRLLEQGIQSRQLRIPLQQQRLGPGNSHHAADGNHMTVAW